MHKEQSELANQTVKIKPGVVHPQYTTFAGVDFKVEDWWDRVTGGSWMDAQGNPACLVYAVRTGFSKSVPTDDEVLYGKTPDGLGHLVHVSEIE